MRDVLLEINNLKTCLGAGERVVHAVDGVDFAIRRHETFALLGESGCGKSMTALSILRLLPPAGRIMGGSVCLDGLDLLTLPERAMRSFRGGRIAMIFQEPMTSLNPVLALGDQIGETVRCHQGLRGGAVSRRVLALLEAVGIPDPRRRLREYPHQLSGGMKQRVMIAIALAGRPDLLIADEPTTALDVTIQAQILDLLKQIQRDTGMAILLITHDLGVVSEVADHVAVMYAGQIVEAGAREPFFNHPLHPYSQKLFASLPGMEKRDRPLEIIHGSVPWLNQVFTGCRFAARCDSVMDLCREQAPHWHAQGAELGARCHLLDVSLPDRRLPSETARPRASPRVPQEVFEPPLLRVGELKIHFPIHKGLFKRVVGHVRAVDGVSLEIPKGRTLALVGESGCGKTTLGKGILQLICPTEGRVQFEGDELTRLRGASLRKRRAEFQIIFQDPFSSMNPRMKVGDIIEEGMQAQGISANERSDRVAALLEHVGLPKTLADRYPHEFSGGQRQRICIARALAVNPKLLVCDEPTSALDVSVQAQILNLLKDLQGRLGLTYLFITHNISVVAYLAHEVAVMYLGRIVEHGSVRDVLENPRHPYTQALLSALPQMDQQRNKAVLRLAGDLPSPAHPPPGCHFYPRCSRAMAVCKTRYPGQFAISSTHATRCFLYQCYTSRGLK